LRLVHALFAASAAALIVLGLLASGAGADSIELTDTTVQISLRGSHGYRISIEGLAGTVALTALSPDGAEAEYTVPGTVTTERLRANFDQLGFISVHLRGGHTQRRTPHNGCPQETETLRRGTFTGTIRFRGEGGYTVVSASHARGSVEHSVAVCPVADRARRPRKSLVGETERVQGTELAAAWTKPNRGTALLLETAVPEAGGEPLVSSFDAHVFEDRGRLEIERQESLEISPKRLTVDRKGGTETARLNLPNPFSGSAEYVAVEGSEGTWKGDLHVSLPGDPNVPLAGPRFNSILCQGYLESTHFKRCSLDADSLYFTALVPEP
jgi:hypothetical protein